MPTPTYTLIDSVTLGSSASSVTFSSISAAGKGDLVLVVDALTSGGNAYILTRLNGDSASNYSLVSMQGNGSSIPSYAVADNSITGNSATTTERLLNIITIADFSATDKHKACLLRSNRTSGLVWASAVRWANTSAVTSLSITPSANQLASGSTFHLYQIVSE